MWVLLLRRRKRLDAGQPLASRQNVEAIGARRAHCELPNPTCHMERVLRVTLMTQ